MFAFGLIFPIAFVLLLVMAVRAIVVTVWVPTKVSREPACEVCGYRVAGLAALICPECGTDLRATGIVTLPMEVRRRGSLFAAIVGWLYIMCVFGGIGASVISLLQVRPMISAAMGGSMTTTTPLTPASGAYTRIDATSILNYGAGMSGSSDFALVLKDGSTWKLSFLPLAGGYTVTAPDGTPTTTSPDDGKAPDALFAAAGLDPTDTKIAAESRELSTVIAVLAATPYTPINTIRLRALTAGTPVTTGGPGTPTGPDMSAMLIAFTVGGVLWVALLVAGIVFIVSRRRKLLRRYPSVRAQTPPQDGAPPPSQDPPAAPIPA